MRKSNLQKEVEGLRKDVLKLEHQVEECRQRYFWKVRSKLAAAGAMYVDDDGFNKVLEEVENLARLLRLTLADNRLS